MGFFGLFGKKPSVPKFKVGDRVRCIDDRKHDIKYGQIYTILDVQVMTCGHGVAYDVGLRNVLWTACDNCGKALAGKGIRWAGEFRFAPLDEASASAEAEAEEAAKDDLMKEVERLLEEVEALN